ncbi:MAG: type transport system ATP-binding protein [Mycobacteriales bacterium]
MSKWYGTTLAVDGLSFAVQPGRVTGFLGPNGAGKSTTMRMMLGLDRPAQGSILIDGRRYPQLPHPVRHVGALLEAKSFHPGRKARHHLRWVAASTGIPARRVGEVLETVGLSAVANKRAGGFSLGMAQRLGLATALLGDPPILLLDEPVNGLDPEGILWIRQFMKNYAAQGRTVFVSSHLLSEMAVTADHLVIIGRGRLIADVPTSEFLDRSAQTFVRVRSPQLDALQPLLASKGLAAIREADGALSVRGADGAAIGELAAANSIVLHELSPQRASLEEAFLAVTRGAQEFQAGAGPQPGYAAQPGHAPGYGPPPGYAPPGYAPPGYAPPGYGPPGYGPPGYGAGYGAPGSGTPGAGTSGYGTAGYGTAGYGTAGPAGQPGYSAPPGNPAGAGDRPPAGQGGPTGYPQPAAPAPGHGQPSQGGSPDQPYGQG